MSTPLELMQRAIDLSRRSFRRHANEPFVGALLAHEGDTLAEAYRGAIESINHAEYALLKHRVDLGALPPETVLFVTLEPCTVANHGHEACTSLILSANISQVFIGIIDPNPTLCGQGYWQLVEHGIDVHLFPPSLAREIGQINRTYVEYHRQPRPLRFELAELAKSRARRVVEHYPQLQALQSLARNIWSRR